MSREKINRNKKIRTLSKKNGGNLSYRSLAKKYNLDVKTVWGIVARK